MTVTLFDLAQRLHADHIGRPTLRLAYSTVRAASTALAVRAHHDGTDIGVTVANRTHGQKHSHGAAALEMLAAYGAAITESAPATLLIDDRRTLPLLDKLAREHATDPDRAIRAASALIGWWTDRADHHGTSAVIDLISASRARYVLGTAPAAEHNPVTWRQWLHISDTTCAGMLDWAETISHGPLLPMLAVIHDEDRYSYAAARAAFESGRDWTAPDTPARAALGLKARNDSADLWDAALLADPLWRRRAVYSGHATTGIVNRRRDGRRLRTVVTCDRIDSRLRAGSKVTGWSGSLNLMPYERFSAEVHDTVMVGGQLVLSLTSVSRAYAPTDGARVCLIPEPPAPKTLASARRSYSLLYRQRSWLSTGRTPAPARRDVPLDILIAAAEDER